MKTQIVSIARPPVMKQKARARMPYLFTEWVGHLLPLCSCKKGLGFLIFFLQPLSPLKDVSYETD